MHMLHLHAGDASIENLVIETTMVVGVCSRILRRTMLHRVVGLRHKNPSNQALR